MRNETVNDHQKAYIAKIPTSATGIVERAFSRIGGRSNAIKAKCLSCANYVREEVRECTTSLCPLHPWRPFQAKAGTGQNVHSDDPNFDPDLDGDPADASPEDDDEL